MLSTRYGFCHESWGTLKRLIVIATLCRVSGPNGGCSSVEGRICSRAQEPAALYVLC